MKISLFSMGLLSLIPHFFMAQQEEHHHLNCGVGNISYEELQKPILFAKNAKTQLLNKQYTSSSGITYLPIKMHLLGNDDGTLFANETEVNDMLAELNKTFKANKIQFFFAGTSFNKYRDSKNNNKEDKSGREEQKFHNNNGVANAINLYVVNSLGGHGGYAYITPTQQKYNCIYMLRQQLNDDKTTPHEFGHYFGLAHTFQNSNHKTISERELVTRNINETLPRLSANCSQKGDMICDTEADPYERPERKNSRCTINEILDANGDIFTPNMNNYMNYYFCPNYDFTQGQRDKMEAGKLLIINNARDFNFSADETSQTPPSELKITHTSEYFGSTLLSWKDNSEQETGYIIEIAEKGSTDFIPIGGVEANITSYTINFPIDNTKEYVFRVKASNTKELYSEISEATTFPKLCANSSKNACNNPNGPNYIINDVILSKNKKKILENLNTGCNGQGTVSYFKTKQAEVEAGDIINFSVKSKTHNRRFFRTDVKLFCDWNNDGDFNDENEFLGEAKNVIVSADGIFTIPENTPEGTYRLRVALTLKDNTLNACTAQNGEIEDYALVVKNPTLSTTDTNNNTDNVQIYPNPASSNLFIKNTKEFTQFSIFDASGKKVKEGVLKEDSINIQNLENGIYYISLIDKKGNTIHKKFIKKK